jgi:hypothetical protein
MFTYVTRRNLVHHVHAYFITLSFKLKLANIAGQIPVVVLVIVTVLPDYARVSELRIGKKSNSI